MGSLKPCSICLNSKAENLSLFTKVCGESLTTIIKSISGIQVQFVSIHCVPDAHICPNCVLALLQAESIIRKCQTTLASSLQNNVNNGDSSSEQMAQNDGIILSEPTKPLDEKPIEIELKHSNSEGFLQNNAISIYAEPSQPLDKKSIEVEPKHEPDDDYLSSTNDLRNSVNSDDDSYTSSKKKISKHKRQYTKKKGGKRVLKTNSKANWHFKCDLCKYESDFAAYYRSHLIEAHQIEKPKIFKCERCQESYQLHSSLQRHTAVVHERRKLPPRARNILCSECGKKFPCRNTLKIHMHVHTGEPLPFKCSETGCGKSYASMAALHNHTSSAHTRERKYACEICGNTYALVFSLKTHMEKCHLGDELQHCPNCGRGYRTPKKYEEHILSERCKNAIYPCQFPNCNKRFSRPRRMRLHMLNIHKKALNSQKPF